MRLQRTHSLFRPAWLLLIGSTVPGCSDRLEPDAGPGATVVRDSAAVRVVTHPAPRWTDTVPDRPVLTIGRAGDPDYEFFGIASVLGLGSGGVVVADRGSRELRYYDAEGTFLRAVGGSGEGPDELGFLSTVWLGAGDTILAMDPNRRRLVRFGPEGGFVGAVPYAPALSDQRPSGSGGCFFPNLAGVFADGGLVTRGWQCVPPEGSDGLRPMEVALHLVPPGLDGPDTVDVFAVGTMWEDADAQNPSQRMTVVPFAPSMREAVGPDRLYVSEGRDREVLVFDRGGRLVEILREGGEPPPVTTTDRDALATEREEQGRPLPAGIVLPERHPAYDRLLLSHEGELWARHAARPGDVHQRWTVFPAEAGRPLRHLVLPEVQVESVRSGRIYGTRTDPLGVQTVVVLESGVAGGG